MRFRSWRGSALILWPWARWQASWYVTVSDSSRIGSAASANTSETSRTLAENSPAVSSQWPYSFMADPHPAALVTMRSTPAASKTRML